MTKSFNSKLDKINQILLRQDQIRIKDLSEELGMNIVTLRRYLKVLEEKGVIYRGYGYVHLKKEAFQYEPPYIYRKRINLNLKKRVAKKALELIEDNDSIFLDVGTSILCLAETLPDDKRLTVVTNWIPNLIALNDKVNIQTFVIGGKLRKHELSVGGMNLRGDLSQFNFSKAFVGVSGISVEEGVSDYYDAEVEVKREVLKIAKEKILLVDSTKFTKSGPLRVCGIEAFDKVIVDDNLEGSIVNSLLDKNVEVILA